MSLVARSKKKWLFSEATQTAVQNEREGELDPSGVWRNDSFQLETFTLNILTKHILIVKEQSIEVAVVKFVQVTAIRYPGPRGFSWNFSSGKRERAAKRQRDREALCLRYAARSFFPEEKFHEKTLGLGYKDGYGRRKFSSEILK